jgi:hypothetical protein
VTNFGTTEHIVNQLNAFKAIHDLAMVGGVMVHNLPCGQPDHGLFGYNQRFFWALGRANDYRIVHMQMDGESIHIALQKQHDMPFIPPLDVDNQAATDSPILKERYWTIFDKKAIDKIAYSREADIRHRERAVYERELAFERRDAGHYVRRLRRYFGDRFPVLGVLKRRLFRAATVEKRQVGEPGQQDGGDHTKKKGDRSTG